jgi:hypothetical protein
MGIAKLCIEPYQHIGYAQLRNIGFEVIVPTVRHFPLSTCTFLPWVPDYISIDQIVVQGPEIFL